MEIRKKVTLKVEIYNNSKGLRVDISHHSNVGDDCEDVPEFCKNEGFLFKDGEFVNIHSIKKVVIDSLKDKFQSLDDDNVRFIVSCGKW